MKALGIVLAGGGSKRMKELTNLRAVSAMHVAGSYRSIDFTLSSMSNSHIQRVGVLTQFNSVSLNEHLNSSKWWDFGRKQGGLFVFSPTITPTRADWYRGTADSLYQNLNFFYRSHEPYVVIASGDGIYKMDFNKVIEYHIQKNADITVVCTNLDEHEDISRFGVVHTLEDGRITDLEEKPVDADTRFVSCGIYVIRRRLLIELLEGCANEERYDIVRDIIIRFRNHKRIYAYDYKGYWSNISSVESYYRTNMDFLKKEVREHFFGTYPEIYSKVEDNPPAKYNPGSQVKNSLVASGCIINGQVEGSVLFKNAYVGNGARIKNSIILGDVYIGDNTTVENCIIESRSTLEAGKEYIGSPEEIKVVVEMKGRYSL